MTGNSRQTASSTSLTPSGHVNLPNSWVETTLGELVELIIDHRGKTPKKLGGDWSESGYRAISAKTIKNGSLVNEEQMNLLSDDLYKKWMKEEIEYGDIFLTSEAPLGEHIVWKSEEKLVLSQRIFGIRTNKKMLDPFYFNYFIDSEFYQHELKSRESGSTVTGIKQSELLKTKVILPPLPEQQAIASVLSAFDDKIELLREQNKTLEEIGQVIFQEWFGKYGLDDELPEGWRVGNLGEVISLIESGSRPKGGIDPNLKDGVPSVGAESVNGIGNYDFSSTKYVTKEYFLSMNRGHVKDYDILIYKDGAYVGKKAMYGNGFPFEEFAINEHVFILRCISWFDQFYLYFYLKKNELAQLNTNSAQPGLNQESMKLFKVLLPPENKRCEFGLIIKEIVDKILFNNLQIQSLARSRDEMLPRLMRGEVRVDF